MPVLFEPGTYCTTGEEDGIGPRGDSQTHVVLDVWWNFLIVGASSANRVVVIPPGGPLSLN